MKAGRQYPFLAGLLITGAALAAYANTRHVPFVFDDIPSIVDNPTIRRLWPPGTALSPTSGWGLTVSGRPVLNYSLALNYAIGGHAVESYHALNLLIHVLAGLTLFGIVRRTLDRPPLAEKFRHQAGPLALAIAAVWTLHPLQTEAVTYVVQRAESLMGLFFLLTLYGFIRAADSPRPRRWWIVSFVACLLGVGTKEVAVLAPVIVWLYDRTFVSGSFRAAWQRHRGLYLALATTWLPLAWLLAGTGGNRGGTMGFDVGQPWSGYWLTQFEAVTRYLWLSFWPHPQVFDYGKIPSPGLAGALPWAVPVVGLAAATLWALWRRPVAGFLGACFFLLLAPTCLVPGTAQMIVEHRMYLPLAAVITVALGGLALRLDRRALIVTGTGLALAAGVLTARRNHVYRDAEALWQDTLAQRPQNARAHNNLGLLRYDAGRYAEAIALYQEAVRLDPDVALVRYNLGISLMRAGRIPEAAAALGESVRILPGYFIAQLELGVVLTQLGRATEALPHLQEAARLDPSPAEAHFRLGVALMDLGREREAIAEYARAIQLNPAHVQAHTNAGVTLFRLHAVPAAIGEFETALRLQPDLADVHFNLGIALTAAGRTDEAFAHYAEAVWLDPQHALAQLNLGIVLAQQDRLTDAIGHLEQAARLRPDLPATQTNLARALLQAGRLPEAVAHYEAAQRLLPDDAKASYNLGFALFSARRWPEARRQLEETLRLDPGFAPAGELLRQLPEPATP